jgi:hypothetical protein
VPIIAVPRSSRFSNAAGEYQASWSRQGQQVVARHRLSLNAVHGADQLCQPADYPAFRDLYQYVRRGFRAQIVYGDLGNAQVSPDVGH